MRDEILVFVYGTLRKGFRNEHYLKDHECLCDASESLTNAELLLFLIDPILILITLSTLLKERFIKLIHKH